MNDLVGTNHGKTVKDATFGGVGHVGKGFTLTGAGYMEVPDNSDLNAGTKDFSIELWLNTSAGSGLQVLVEKRAGAHLDVQGYSFFLYDGRLHSQLAEGGNSAFTNYDSGASVADGKWHHVALSVDRDQISGLVFYVDGVAAKSFNPTGRSGSLSSKSPLRMGSTTTEVGGEYTGLLDEVSYYGKALSAAEVAAIFKAGSLGKCKTQLP